MREKCANEIEVTTVREETRTALMDAAERLLGQFGYRRLSVEDIATEAGLSRRTFYLYFSNKEEITLATDDRRIARLVAWLEQEAGAELSDTERLRRMLVGRVLFLFDDAQKRIATFDEIVESTRTAYMPRRIGYLRAEAAVFARVLAQGQKSGELWVDDPEQLALTLLLATNALMPYSLSAQQRRDRSWVEGETTRIVDLLLRGLRATESGE
jgi:AcrR family transcriptional regulator